MTSHKAANTKLPKPVITKFNGTHVDWLRFWNQFEAAIDTRSNTGRNQVLLPQGIAWKEGSRQCRWSPFQLGRLGKSEKHFENKIIMGKPARLSTHICRQFWHYLTSLEVSQRRYTIFTRGCYQMCKHWKP